MVLHCSSVSQRVVSSTVTSLSIMHMCATQGQHLRAESRCDNGSVGVSCATGLPMANVGTQSEKWDSIVRLGYGLKTFPNVAVMCHYRSRRSCRNKII